jgi:hypothetical protein
MADNRKPQGPLVQCAPATAALIGAKPDTLRQRARLRRQPCIVVVGHDGSRWLWPVEQGFLDAILRE